eukprot:SM000170S02692  [mRNA]  locus=s170:200411:203629:- [translate_table: standard]
MLTPEGPVGCQQLLLYSRQWNWSLTQVHLNVVRIEPCDQNATSAVLVPLAVWQWRATGSAVRRRCWQPASLAVLAASAGSLALHFALWVLSLDRTSLVHSLLYVSTPPLLLAGLAWLQGQQLGASELAGIAAGCMGAALCALGAHADGNHEVSLLGDAAALAAAAAFVVYITAGKHLRGQQIRPPALPPPPPEWMPLYLYAAPVTAAAAGLLTAAGAAIEGVKTPVGGPVCRPLSWLSSRFFWRNAYLALGPGFVGHTGLNLILRHVQPLVIAMGITAEPLLGSLMGWAAGLTRPPGWLTTVGGFLIVAATVWVTYAGERSSPNEPAQAIEIRELQPLVEGTESRDQG